MDARPSDVYERLKKHVAVNSNPLHGFNRTTRTTFRLSTAARSYLGALSEDLNCSEADVLRTQIDRLFTDGGSGVLQALVKIADGSEMFTDAERCTKTVYVDSLKKLEALCKDSTIKRDDLVEWIVQYARVEYLESVNSALQNMQEVRALLDDAVRAFNEKASQARSKAEVFGIEIDPHVVEDALYNFSHSGYEAIIERIAFYRKVVEKWTQLPEPVTQPLPGAGMVL